MDFNSGSTAFSYYYCMDTFTMGNHTYLATNGFEGLQIMDISDPYKPARLYTAAPGVPSLRREVSELRGHFYAAPGSSVLGLNPLPAQPTRSPPTVHRRPSTTPTADTLWMTL